MNETEYEVNIAVCLANGTWDKVKVTVFLDDNCGDPHSSQSRADVWAAAEIEYEQTHASNFPHVAVGMIDFEMIQDEDNSTNIDDGEADYTIEDGDDEK